MDKLFVVDDEKYYLNTLRRVLHNIYEVECFSSGKDILEYLDEDLPLPDLILLDIMMPKMNGYELCERLRSIEKTKDIPIIFVSGLDSYDAEARGIEFGVEDYIYKPYNTDVLKARMANVIRINKHKNKETDEKYDDFTTKMLSPWLKKLSNRDDIEIEKTLFEAYWISNIVYSMTASELERKRAYCLKLSEIIDIDESNYDDIAKAALEKYREDVDEHWDGSGKKVLRKKQVEIIARAKDVVETYSKEIYLGKARQNGIDKCIKLSEEYLDPEIVQLFIEHIKKEENNF